MTKKRRRKRSRRGGPRPGHGQPSGAPTGARDPSPAPAGDGTAAGSDPETPPPDEGPDEGGQTTQAAAPRRGLFRGASQSPYPPFGVSVARGFRAVGASPVTLAAAFLSTIATWAVFLALDMAPTLRSMVVLMTPMPLQVFFDAPAVFRAGGSSTYTLVAFIVVGTVRATTFGLVMLLILGSLRDGRPDLRASLRRLPAVVPSLFAVYIAEVALVIMSTQVILGLLGPAFEALIPLVALHFLVLIPVVIVAERVPVRDGLRLGYRAARLPGARHLGMVVAYFLATLYILFGVPAVSPATPTILGWAFVLTGTFVHVGTVATFMVRWLAVREEPAVVERAAPARRQR